GMPSTRANINSVDNAIKSAFYILLTNSGLQSFIVWM
ncbi:hypothetical protein LCGC14_2731180, partial [marine sediment metagenome]